MVVANRPKPLVYVSYAWRSQHPEDLAAEAAGGLADREQIVDELCGKLAEEDGIAVGRDKGLMKTGDSIVDFAGEIAKSELILAVVSKKFLRSPWCMKEELLQAFRRRNFDPQEFGEDVLPLILDDAQADFEDANNLIDFWCERQARERKIVEKTDPERKYSISSWRDVDELQELVRFLPDLLKVLKIRKMPRGAEAIRDKGFEEIRQLVMKRLREKAPTPFTANLATLHGDQPGARAPEAAPKLAPADVVALVLAPSGGEQPGLRAFLWKAFVQRAGETGYQDIPNGAIGAAPSVTKETLPELLQCLKRWIDTEFEDVSVLEIFAPQDLLDEDWGGISVEGGDAPKPLHAYQPYLLRSSDRLLNPQWNHRRGALKRMHHHLVEGDGAWLPQDKLNKTETLETLDGKVLAPEAGEEVIAAIRCLQATTLSNRTSWLQSVLRSMAPLVVWPSRTGCLAEDQIQTCLRQLRLNREDTSQIGSVDRPHCPDLAHLAWARQKWDDPTLDPRGLTILVDHPDRGPDRLLLQALFAPTLPGPSPAPPVEGSSPPAQLLISPS